MILRVLDLETCGLTPEIGCRDIVEVATLDLVKGEDGVWRKGRSWSTLVNPSKPIPPEASAVHHIVDEMVADAPSLAEVVPAIFADGPVHAFCAHHAKYEQSCWPDNGQRWICTYRTGVTAWPDAPSHKNQVLRYWLKLKLADPEAAVPHRASGDVYVTGAILRRMLSDFVITPDELVEMSSNPVVLPRLHFGEHAGKPIAEVPESYWAWIAHKSKGPWDEDVMHTAKYELARRRAASRSRSPVSIDNDKEIPL